MGRKTQGRKTLETNQSMDFQMETNENLVGSSEARDRQGGDIVPVSARSEELAPASSNGQNTSRVSTAGTRVGLATAEEGAPPLDMVTLMVCFPALKEFPEDARVRLWKEPRPLGPGEFLRTREQMYRGVIRDTICIADLQDNGEYRVVETYQFEGWLEGVVAEIKPLLIRGDPEGRFERLTLERLELEEWEWKLEDWQRSQDRNPNVYGNVKRPPKPDKWLGDEPDKVLSPLQPPITGLRGGADGEGDSDDGPAGPHKPRARIIGHEILTGTHRVNVQRMIPASAEESEMEVDIEGAPLGPSPGPTDEDNCESDGEPVAGPSKPRKRARGRPRKDGSGPFRPESPSNTDLVRNAFQGEVPALRVVDLVPIVDRPEARRAGGRLPKRLDTTVPPSGRAPEDEEPTNTTRWRANALTRLEDCTNEQAAILALDALDRVEKARGSSKNLKGDVSHDLRVSAAIARHAILALCQRSSRFEMEAMSKDLINKLRAECLQLTEKTEELKLELNKQTCRSNYLLASNESRRSSPARDPVPGPSRGRKRDLRERRGEPDPEPPATMMAEVEYDSLVPEIVMGSSTRVEGGPPYDRPLSPMARYAAADPQFMGVLKDIAESLRGLERRVGALERRLLPAAAPQLGVVGAGTSAVTPGSTSRSMRRRMRQLRRGSGQADTPSTVPKQTPKGPVARARAGPLGPDVVTPARTASGKKGATSVSRVVPPGAAKPPPAKVALSGARGAAGKREDKGKGRKAGTGGGADPPTGPRVEHGAGAPVQADDSRSSSGCTRREVCRKKGTQPSGGWGGCTASPAVQGKEEEE